MKVYFISAYYSNKAHEEISPRKPDYWDSYKFVWAVKSGQYKYPFHIHSKNGRIFINSTGSIVRARRYFGDFIHRVIVREGLGTEAIFIPVPSKDGITGKTTSYRSLQMLAQSVSHLDRRVAVIDGLRWTQLMPKAHVGGGGCKNVSYWKDHLQVKTNVAGRKVVLVDDVVSTGSSLLAAKEALEEAGAEVVFAITCGKTVYSFKEKAFKPQMFELAGMLNDFNPAA
jgi:hypothetical protein